MPSCASGGLLGWASLVLHGTAFAAFVSWLMQTDWKFGFSLKGGPLWLLWVTLGVALLAVATSMKVLPALRLLPRSSASPSVSLAGVLTLFSVLSGFLLLLAVRALTGL